MDLQQRERTSLSPRKRAKNFICLLRRREEGRGQSGKGEAGFIYFVQFFNNTHIYTPPKEWWGGAGKGDFVLLLLVVSPYYYQGQRALLGGAAAAHKEGGKQCRAFVCCI